MFIQTEATPNPETLKFIPGVDVMGAGTANFTTAEDAARSPLAARLFDRDDVTGVFLGSDFITLALFLKLLRVPPSQGWEKKSDFAQIQVKERKVTEGFAIFEKRLIGKDPIDPSALYDENYFNTQHFGRRGLVINALSGIDVALWDIIGKYRGTPTHEVLGSHRDHIDFYFNELIP